jgi:hypothetical protein
MDASFDPTASSSSPRRPSATFRRIARRDLTAVQDRITPQEYARLQAQCDQLRGARRTNRIEQFESGGPR